MHATFKDNIWVINFAKMRLLFSKNWGVKCSLCVIDVFIKNTRVKPLKDKKAKTVFHDFVEIVNESSRTPNKLWVDQEK